VGNVIKRWLTTHFHDFANDPQSSQRLEELIAIRLGEKYSVLGNQLKKTLQRGMEEEKKVRQLVFSEAPPPAHIPRSNNFEDFDPLEIARQVTLYESQLYRSIHPKECLNQNWNKHKEQAPNIIKMVTWFNDMSHWVAGVIVSKENLKERCSTIKTFIRIATKTLELNNFNATQEILAGLNLASVYRLRNSWGKLETSKEYVKFEEFNTLLGGKMNYKHYRERIATIDPPCVPFFGVYLTDLTFIEDGNKDYIKVRCGRTDIINFEKMRMVAGVIKRIQQYQLKPYNFTKVPAIYDHFANGLKTYTEDELYVMSQKVEPRDTPPIKSTPSMSKLTTRVRKASFSSVSKAAKLIKSFGSPKPEKKERPPPPEKDKKEKPPPLPEKDKKEKPPPTEKEKR